MEFKWNDEQQLMQTMFREFVDKELRPIAAELDEQERFPAELIPKMGEIGLLGIPIAEEFGGVGMGNLEYVMAVEEISKACASTGVTISAHTSLCCWPIEHFGTQEQKEKYLPDLASGEKLGAFGLTEPSAGTDAAMQRTIAEDKGDHWLLNGSKIFITNGEVADTYVVFAMTDKAAGNKGISAFIVEKGWEGFSFGSHEKKMGIRGSSTCELVFENVKVPKENLLGELNKGFKIAMMTLDGGRIGIAAQALGIAQGAYEAAVEYARTPSSCWRRCRPGWTPPACWSTGPPPPRTPGTPTPTRRPWPSCLPPRPPGKSPGGRCSSSAAMATPATTPWSA